MSVLLADFQQRVGQRLGIVRASEPLSVEDAELILAAYVSLWHELNAHDLTNWAPTDAVPTYVSEIMVGMTAARLVDEFELPEPRRSSILVQSSFGMATPTPDERRLRRLMAVPQFDDELQSDYF